MIKRFLRSYRLYGFVPTFQKSILKVLGIADLKEKVDTLYYFLNYNHDVSEVPPTGDPDLRILQLCNVQLLRIVTKEIEKLGLTYWLDFGTLLGAIRHKGFIPWDDDMDITMPRKDYNRALIELKAKLIPLGIEFDEPCEIGIGYRHKDTGIWLDIFARDDYFCESYNESMLESLSKKIDACRNAILKKSNSSIAFKEEMRKKYIGGDAGDNRFLYLQPEFEYKKNLIHLSETIYPLSHIKFEGYSFKAPNNSDLYLKGIYGPNYLKFPRDGILHHDLGRGPLSTWAKRNGVDMKIILNELTSIADSI